MGHSLAQSRIETLGWDSHTVPLYKMIEDSSPQLIIYGPNANMSGVAHVKQRHPAIALCYIGDHPKDEIVADIVIGESLSRKSIPRPDRVYDVTGVVLGERREDILCDSVCFTDSITDVSGVVLNVFSYMNSKYTRFFGGVRLETPNYLGIVTEQEMADIIASCSIYIDMVGDYWTRAIMAGCPAIVFSEKEIPGVLTFTDISSLIGVWSKAQEDDYNLEPALQEISNNTGHGLCGSLLASLGAFEATESLVRAKGEII